MEEKKKELAKIISSKKGAAVAPKINLEKKVKKKRQIEMEIAKIEPSGKLRIDFSEELQNFDFFKNLDLTEVKFAEIQDQILHVTYMCKQIPYNSSMKHDAERNEQRRQLGEIDPHDVLIKQNITNEKEIPPEEDEVLPELYNWWITDFGSADMDLQLNFTNPLLVSAYFDKDLLQI